MHYIYYVVSVTLVCRFVDNIGYFFDTWICQICIFPSDANASTVYVKAIEN